MRSWAVRRWSRALVGAIAVVALAACGREKQRAPGTTAGARVTKGGTVAVAMSSDFGPLNPILATDQYTDELVKYGLYTPLIQFDSALNAVPYLARSWEMLGDSGVVFHLRTDVRWHDGQPVTAEDVKYTFDMAKNPATASLLAEAYLGYVDRADVLDPHTIRFHFTQPHAQAIQDFWWAPAPKHLLQNIPPAELRNADFNRHPVGSGPYHFGEWRANDRLVIEREMLFPKELGGPAPLDRLVFRVIPEPATQMAELVSGGVQVDIPLQPAQMVQVRSSPQLRLFAYPSRTVYFVAWNNQRPPFNNPDVRRALTMAINRKQLTDALLYGQGKIAIGPIPPWSPMYTDLPPLPYDPAEARKLLNKAGFVDRNGDGMLEAPNGQPFRITLITSNAPLQKSMAEVIQAQMRSAGVTVDVRPLEFQTFLAQYRSKDFEGALANWQLDNFQVASAARALFSSRLAKVPNSTNRAGVASPELDRLIEKASRATDDRKAKEYWEDFEKELEKEQPFTFLFWWAELAAADKRVQGIVMDPRGELQSIRSWWLQGGRVAGR